MRIIESRSIDNQAGLLGSRLITGTNAIDGAFQSFIVAEDTVVTKVYNSIGIDVTSKLGLTSITLKAGAFISMPKNDYFSSIKLTSGSVVAYFVSHGGMTITAQAYLNEFLARVGSSYLEAEDCVKNHLQQLINIGLLQKASLVMSPSMYEEDLVKSVVPQDASGDLSFTRASNGTRVNSAGLVEVCPWNLASYSEEFDNAAWVKTTDGQVTITANATTAPNGTTTAEKMIASANAGFHCVAQTQSLVAGVFTISIYAKASEYSFLQIFDSLTTDFANFNLTTGAVATVDTYTATIESVGNGWYRCTATKTNPSGNFVFRYGIVTTGTATRGESFTGNGVNGLFIWGAQLNIGSTAKPYFPTTDRLNVPRLTYQNGGGGCPSLLLEKQSTNLATYSEQIDNAVWTKGNATVNANVSVSPDGTSNADKVIPSTSVAFHNVTNSLILTIGTVYTISAFAKADGYNYVAIGNGFGTRQALFNLSNGDITTVTSSTTAEIKNYGNGWYRCSITFETTNTLNQPQITVDNGSNAQYAGNGTSGAFIWGTSVEISSYPTSYIPTTSSSATRVADACSKTGISSLIGSSEGVLFTDFVCNGFQDYGTPLCVNDGTVNNSIWLTTFGNGTLRGEIFGSGSVQASFSMSGAVVGQRYKMALAYKANDFAMYINGTQIGTDSSGSVPSSLSRVDYDYANPSAFALSLLQINQSALFKTRLTNAELASLTTI